jgi:hypothetical protein
MRAIEDVRVTWMLESIESSRVFRLSESWFANSLTSALTDSRPPPNLPRLEPEELSWELEVSACSVDWEVELERVESEVFEDRVKSVPA